MAKYFLLMMLAITASPIYADVNSDVQQCLRGSTGSNSTSKASCVQAAINKESNNQITKMFQLYSNFVSQELNSNAFGASSNQATTPQVITTPVRTPTPAPVQPPPPPPPISQTPATPQNQGGIQYY